MTSSIHQICRTRRGLRRVQDPVRGYVCMSAYLTLDILKLMLAFFFAKIRIGRRFKRRVPYESLKSQNK